MLHLKLTKKKFAGACERVAERITLRIAENVPNTESGDENVRRTQIRANLTDYRQKFHDLADASLHSTGDVYVSFDLWTQIKDVYDG